MKLVARSEVPSGLPYLHLGYLAAGQYCGTEGLSLGGIVFLVTAVLLALRKLVSR